MTEPHRIGAAEGWVNSFTWREPADGPAGPRDVAWHAANFLRAGDLCYEDYERVSGTEAMLVLPAVVNWCLSIELYLKALILNAGGNPGKTHLLGQLLALTSSEDRVAIERQWGNAVATLSLSDLLVEVGNYFSEVRYDYEAAERAYQEAAIRRALTAIAEVASTTSWREGPLFGGAAG